jgi:hypothetical protein
MNDMSVKCGNQQERGGWKERVKEWDEYDQGTSCMTVE